jgi:hypothetical protein
MQENAHTSEGRRHFLRSGIPIAVAAASGLLAELPACADAATLHPVGTAETIAALRKLPIPDSPVIVQVAGYHTPGDGGGGGFVWDAHFAPAATELTDDGGTYLLPQESAPERPGRWRRLFSGALNVKWFGALGDDTGKTPGAAGADIAQVHWNNHWPQSILTQQPLKTAKFANDDSWDYIGIQMALLSASRGAGANGEVYIPGGIYRLTQHLLYAADNRTTLTGAGMYQTTLTKTPDRFTHSFLLRLFDTGGQPTTIRDICFRGPIDAQQQYHHAEVGFTLIAQNHTNGVHFLNCWFTSCHTAFDCSLSTDCYMIHCTAEYCGTVIKMDAGTDLHVSNCNFWQSAPATEQYTGIISAGMLHCADSRFFGFEAIAIQCTGGMLHAVGNAFYQFSHAVCVIDAAAAGQSVISGNRIVGATVSPMIRVGQDNLVTGNFIEQRGEHACIDLTNGKTNINISGNVLCCTPADKKIVEGGLIISVLPNVNFVSGCSQCLITGNTLNQPNSIAVEARRNMIVNNLMA